MKREKSSLIRRAYAIMRASGAAPSRPSAPYPPLIVSTIRAYAPVPTADGIDTVISVTGHDARLIERKPVLEGAGPERSWRPSTLLAEPPRSAGGRPTASRTRRPSRVAARDQDRATGRAPHRPHVRWLIARRGRSEGR